MISKRIRSVIKKMSEQGLLNETEKRDFEKVIRRFDHAIKTKNLKAVREITNLICKMLLK